MRLLITVIMGFLLFDCCVGAQEEDNVATATSALQDVLTNLKQSVEKLSVDNDQLANRDNAIKSQILQLQTQLGQMEAQGDLLDKTVSQLQDKNPGWARQITNLESENYDLDNRNQKTEADIKLIRQSMDAGYQEDQKLLLQLKGLSNITLPSYQAPTPASPLSDHLKVEKLKLMKMIEDSQSRQESLHEAILKIQQNAPLQPAAAALERQQFLKAQIKDMETQLAAYPREKQLGNGGNANQWDASQMSQLESDLKVLERNYLQLKDLMAQMTIKAQSIQMTPSQRIEENKLQNSVDQLKQQGQALKATLEDLRTQMVDLDKRKTRLEQIN